MILDRIDTVLAILRKAGFRLGGPWWRELLLRVYGGRARRVILRVGRRGGKSKIGELIAVLEMLFGDHDVPTGDTGWFALVSVDRTEAGQRIRGIKAMLDALGQAYAATADTIELVGINRGVRVLTSSIEGSSGYTCIGVWVDEAAKLKSGDGVNPCREVVATLTAACATMPNARVWLSSSPWGILDFHAECFDAGDSEYQLTAFAPSWIANDSLTEEGCRALAGDERTFLREFAAIPQATLSNAWDSELIKSRIVTALPLLRWIGPRALVIDPSDLRPDGDLFAWADVNWCWPAHERRTWVASPDAPRVQTERIEPLPYKPPFVNINRIGSLAPPIVRTARDVVSKLSDYARRYGIRTVVSDQRERVTYETLFHEAGMNFVSYSWTAGSKKAAADHIAGWLRDDAIAIPNHGPLVQEMYAYSERITPSGNIVLGARQGGHDDHVACLMTLATHDIAGGLSGSPLNRKVHRDFRNLPQQ